MGTAVTVLLPEASLAAATAVQDLFDDWDRRLSRFRADSELSALNALAGADVIVSPLLFDAVREAVLAAQATDGAFDLTILPRLVELGYDRTFDELPMDRPPTSTDGTWRPGAWRDIRLDARRRQIRLPAGTAIDLGGIAKGMAVDTALDLLVDQLAIPALVEAGGDLAVVGLPPDRDAWIIERGGASGSQELTVRSGAVATSTTQRRRWRSGGEWQHHVIDPRTGLSTRSSLGTVTVAAGSCREADVAATAALVLGPVDGPAFIRRVSLTAAFDLDDGTTVHVEPPTSMAGVAA
jgi:thiamine biosynthesis lipoprotein